MQSLAAQPARAALPNSGRIGRLDGVRTIAVLAVLLHHVLGTKLLWAGVDLFFVLSGFLITGILIGEKGRTIGSYFGRFYARRARRILPPLALLMLITTIWLGTGWMRYGYMYLFLMNVQVAYSLPHPLTVGPLWSLAVEEQFYMVWPFFVFFLNEKAIAWLSAGLILLAPALRWLCTPLFTYHWQIYMLTPFRMDLLATGALFAVLWRHHPERIKRYGAWGLLLAALSAGALLKLSHRPNFNTFANTRIGNVWIYELCLTGSAGIILWALSGRFTWLLDLAPMRYIGRISYSIYLIHLTVLYLFLDRFPNRLQLLAIVLPLTLLYAALSWHFMEKPILYGGRRSRLRKEALAEQREITGFDRG